MKSAIERVRCKACFSIAEREQARCEASSDETMEQREKNQTCLNFPSRDRGRPRSATTGDACVTKRSKKVNR